VIAPLLSTGRGLWLDPEIYLLESAESLAVTWVTSFPGYQQFEVRAELFRDGSIEFAYLNVDEPPFGAAIVVTSGTESWRSEATEIAAATDPVGDTKARDPFSVMLDLVNSRLTRTATGRLQFEVEFGEAFDFTKIPENATATIGFAVNGLQFFVDVEKTGVTHVQTPGPGVSEPVTIDDRRLTFDTLEQNFSASTVTLVEISTSIRPGSAGNRVDEVLLSFVMPPPVRLETDFSTVTAEILAGPIVETFTIPALSETRVWQALQAAYGLRDDEWDAVAIYQNFDTDLVFHAAGSAGFGNPLVQGISNGTMWGNSLRPTLMNVGHIDRNPAVQTPRAHLLLHEFGHRWLFHPEFHDGSGNSTALLGRQQAHPHDFVDTRAAFPVIGTHDYSAMGGARIDEVGGGFRKLYDISAGYSWLDLYLMGLADASEVPPVFYLRDVSRVDDDIWQGTRVDVPLSQIVTAMGPRRPTYPKTKRDFRVAFVLLADPWRAPTAAQIALAKSYRAAFERDFALATGGRAAVSTKIIDPARRRSVRH
jgi:hypothetical protein